MADSKVADLSAITDVDGNELLYVVDDPSGTPADKKITAANLLANARGVEAASRGTTGSLASTYDRAVVGGNQGAAAATSGTLRLTRILLPKGLTVTSITYYSGSTALSAGSNQWFALFDSSRNKLAVTGDDTSTAWATNTAKTLNLSPAFLTTYAGWYYVGIVVVATTVPTIEATATLLNVGARAAAPTPTGNSTAGLTNPASCPNPAGAITILAPTQYAEVS